MKLQPIMFTLALIVCISLAAQAQSSSIAGAWKSEVPAGEEGQMVPVKLLISEDGTYTVDFGMDGVVEIKGHYSIEGNRLTVQDDAYGENPCTGKGVYTFSVDAANFSANRISDECENRGGPDGKMSFTRM